MTDKGFPASEAIIGGTAGKNLLLTGAATYGGLTDLIKNDPKQVASIGVRISIDGKGNFTGVTYNGKTYSVADWNKAQQAAPAWPHHNYQSKIYKDRPNNETTILHYNQYHLSSYNMLAAGYIERILYRFAHSRKFCTFICEAWIKDAYSSDRRSHTNSSGLCRQSSFFK